METRNPSSSPLPPVEAEVKTECQREKMESRGLDRVSLVQTDHQQNEPTENNPTQDTGESKSCQTLQERFKKWTSWVTLEPAIFLHGICFWTMQCLIEMAHTYKVCIVGKNMTSEVCDNLILHEKESSLVQKEVTSLVFHLSIISSTLIVLMVIPMGAWSDKYGRRIPLIISCTCHALWGCGYMLTTMFPKWPTWLFYLFTFLDSIGGGSQGFTSTSIAYISDVSSVEERTKRVGIAMSFWYIGGPLGSILVSNLIGYGGLDLAFQIIFLLQLCIVSYVVVLVKESSGPFCNIKEIRDSPKFKTFVKKEDVTALVMLRDFCRIERYKETIQTVYRKREGGARSIYVIVILCNMIRRIARSFHMFLFVQRVLHWDPAQYSRWNSYRSTFCALGSMFLMKKLLSRLKLIDTDMVIMAAVSVSLEYVMYGLMSFVEDAHYLMWVGPPLGLLSYSITITLKAMATKLVTPNEKGRVSAVMSASQSLVIMFGSKMFEQLYNATVDTLPGAQFFLSLASSLTIVVIFTAIRIVKPKIPVNNSHEDNQGADNVQPTNEKQGSSKGDQHYDNPTFIQS